MLIVEHVIEQIIDEDKLITNPTEINYNNWRCWIKINEHFGLSISKGCTFVPIFVNKSYLFYAIKTEKTVKAIHSLPN